MIRIDKNKITVVELSNNEIDLIENLLFDHRLEHLKNQNNLSIGNLINCYRDGSCRKYREKKTKRI